MRELLLAAALVGGLCAPAFADITTQNTETYVLFKKMADGSWHSWSVRQQTTFSSKEDCEYAARSIVSGNDVYRCQKMTISEYEDNRNKENEESFKAFEKRMKDLEKTKRDKDMEVQKEQQKERERQIQRNKEYQDKEDAKKKSCEDKGGKSLNNVECLLLGQDGRYYTEPIQ